MQKVRVKERLLLEWEGRMDRENWVLPRVEREGRGGWRGGVCAKKERGWEGEGRVVCWEVEVRSEGDVEIWGGKRDVVEGEW